MMNLSKGEYLKHSDLEMKAKQAQFELLLFELLHDDPIANLAFMNCVSHLAFDKRKIILEILK
jgi:hypothetical protein